MVSPCLHATRGKGSPGVWTRDRQLDRALRREEDDVAVE
jgi:hypothetical protein